MPTRLTRILSGLHEWSEVVLEEGGRFSTRHFTIDSTPSGWVLEPRNTDASSFGGTFSMVSINSHAVAAAHPVHDDDLIEEGTNLWVFHTGESARQDAFERAAVAADAGEAPWQVLAD